MNIHDLAFRYADVARAESCTGVSTYNWQTAFGPEKTEIILGLIGGELRPVEFVALMQAYGYDHHFKLLKCLIDAFVPAA